MTMPKFEPVAWRYELKAGEYTFAEKRYLNETYAPRPTALHTADQLTETYEAGKLDASEYLEQAAFEKWLYDKCPSGDVESVQRQWLESYEYAELVEKLEQAAQKWGAYDHVVHARVYKELRKQLAASQQALRNVYEVWAGSEHLPMATAAFDSYLLGVIAQMRDAAKEGMK